MRRRHMRLIAISFFVIAITFFNFTTLEDSACIRSIHVVTLLTCGIAIGVLLLNLFALIFKKEP